GAKGISAFIIEKGTKGFSHGPKLKKLGMNSSDTCELYFEDCRIPKENLLGELGMGFIDTMKVLDSGRVGIAAIGVGIARGSMEEAIKYAHERVQFGTPIYENQAIKWKVVNMAVQTEAARLLVLKAACLKDQGKVYSK